METVSPQLRLSSPLANAVRSLLFVSEGRLLLLGDGGGQACLFDLTARRVLSLLSPSEAACVSVSLLGLPFGAAGTNFAARGASKGSSPVLHLQQLSSSSSSSSSSRVLLQQKDSRISIFDLASGKFAGALRTGAFSFCKCASPNGTADPLPLGSSSSSSSNSEQCVLSTECVAAPTGELETAGIFDLRCVSSLLGEEQQAVPSLQLRLPAGEVLHALFQGPKTSSAGSLQSLAFVSSPFELLAAYEFPSVALWDLRQSRTPLAFTALSCAKSPPTDLAVAGRRAWAACVEGELQILRVKKVATNPKTPKDAETTQCLSSSSSSSGGSSRNGRGCSSSCLLDAVASASLFASVGGGVGAGSLPPSCCQEAFASYEHLDSHRLHLTSLALRADGLLGACGSSAGNIHLYEGKHLRPLGALPGHHTAVSAVAFCPASALLASGDKEGVVNIWDVYRDSYARPACPFQGSTAQP